jgi:NAD(P)-dependent dehydrogenase (short-subunit alcohol dehydrogenase family)
MNLFDMTGKVGLVSGAASGMGKAMATAFAEAGADVMLVDKNTARWMAATSQSTVAARYAHRRG